jgi:hypothetical protein
MSCEPNLAILLENFTISSISIWKSRSQTAKMTRLPLDDLLVEDEVSHNVDYLSFYWEPEDLWSTRRYLRRRKTQLERYWRLENAIWRSWAKQDRRLQCSPAKSIQWWAILLTVPLTDGFGLTFYSYQG